MSSILERVQKLIALVDSPHEEEARSAAVAAVRLIKEHRLLLVGRAPANENGVVVPTKRREELRKMATAKVLRFIEFLRRKALGGVRPFYNARYLVDRSVDDRTIKRTEREIFHHYLRRALRDHSALGAIEYLAGKGYRLRTSLMWGNAA